MKDELTELAIKYGTDRHPGAKHSYTPFYYNLFKSKRETVKKVLEIGVGEGAGLRMWRDFFPNAFIFGAEVDPRRIFKENRIEVFYCDQYVKSDLVNLIKQIGSDIDLVIDDGSHFPEYQVFTCLTLMPLLKKDVIYVIEDVANPDIEKEFVAYDHQMPQLIRRRKRYDDRLIVIRKKMPINLSFFAKRPAHAPPDGHLQRVSTIIRAYQIAEYTGAKLNPIVDYQNDACVYIKPTVSPDNIFNFEGKPYLDILDSNGLYNLAIKYPKVPVISSSDWNYKLLKRILPNKIINIPEQNCNFEQVKKSRDGITTVGCIGTLRAFPYLPKGLKESLAERDIELLEFSKFFTRQDIIDFYMQIDVQIIWRPYFDYRRDILMNPLKIVNASAFGVPTIAYDEPAFKEMNGCYLPVRTLDEFLNKLDELRDSPRMYAEYSDRCFKKSEKYHIEKIAKLYLDLI